LVIGPLTSATLRVVPTAQHGIASAAVVVSRMIGMLIGMAALSAWGLYKFNQNLAAMPTHKPTSLADAAAQLERNVRTAYAMQYASIFQITAIICIVGAVLGLLIAGRKEHAEEPDTATEADPVPVT
jgi:hypothetical protein